MNNIRSLIPCILGSFWDRVFKDSGLVSFIRDIHYKLSKPVYLCLECVKKGSSCLSDGVQYSYDAISIPVDSCMISTGTLKTYRLDGFVYQPSPSRSLMIPVSMIGKPAVIVSNSVWVTGVNMDIGDEYVTIYMSGGQDLVTDTRIISGELVRVYVLSVGRKHFIKPYINYSELLGINMDILPDYVRTLIWKASVTGTRASDIHALLSYLIGNQVSMSSSMVVSVWKECDKYVVATDDNHVYSGCGIPIVSVGDKVNVGDLLFYGLHVFNHDRLPHPDYVPSLSINTSSGDILARNMLTRPIKTSIDYIPDMCNKEWANKVASTPGRKLMITTEDEINTLHYSLTRLLPRSSYIYSLSDIRCVDHTTIATITKYIHDCIISSCVNPMNRNYTTKPASITIGCKEPIVSVFVPTPRISVNIYLPSPIVHII